MSEPEKLRAGYSPLSDKEIDEAEQNLVRCLDAYDQKGDAGLREAMNQIYPPSGLARKPIPGTYDSYAQWSDKSYMEARQVTAEEEAEAKQMYT